MNDKNRNSNRGNDFHEICILLILCCGIALIQCQNAEKENRKTNNIISNDKSDQFQLRVEKISDFKIKPDSGLRLGSIRDLVAVSANDSLLMWVNTMQNQLFLTDTQGNVVDFFGREGAGPGEFRDITAFGFYGSDNVAVYDWKLDLIKIFDFQGNLIEERPGLLEMDLWIRSGRIFNSNDNLLFGVQQAVGQGDIWDTSVVASLAPSGELHSLFGGYGNDLKERKLFYNHPDFTHQRDTERVFITYSSYHIIEVASADSGKTIQRFGVVSENFKYAKDQVVQTDSREERDEKNLNQSNVGPPFVSERYLFFNFHNFTEEFFESIDRQVKKYDPNLRENYFAVYDNSPPFAFYGEIQLPYAPLGVSSKGDIYLLENDNPDQFSVGVYRMKFEEI
ncbi:MAG: 6-bladed beta-propeller [Bacteroidetes bacterium]|jgi:hypothetical protein|nr:6-bladed beta-propeller [Bacteroidota bacterium]